MFLCWSCRSEDHHKLPPLWEASLGPPLWKTCPNPSASATNHPTHACLGRLKAEGSVDRVPIAKAGWGPDTVRQSQSSPKAWPGTNCGAWWPWSCPRKQVPQKHHSITKKRSSLLDWLLLSLWVFFLPFPWQIWFLPHFSYPEPTSVQLHWCLPVPFTGFCSSSSFNCCPCCWPRPWPCSSWGTDVMGFNMGSARVHSDPNSEIPWRVDIKGPNPSGRPLVHNKISGENKLLRSLQWNHKWIQHY